MLEGTRPQHKQSEELVEVYLEDSPVTTRFCGMSAPVKQIVLELGTTMFDHVKQNAHDTDEREWRDRIATLKSSHLRDIERLREKLELSEDKYDTFTQQAQKRTQQSLAATETSIKGQYSSEIDRHKSTVLTLEARYEALLDKHQSLHTDLDRTYSLRMAEQAGAHTARIAELEERLERYRREYDERIAALTLRAENSTIKGQDGETFMLSQLTLMFPHWEIDDTHTEPGRGDFLLRHGETCIMVENKNYSKNVQKSEVDKFYRDIDNPANKDIHCAMMVSMTTGICCKGDFEFEMRNGKPIIFLHKVKDNMNSIMLAVKFLELILKQADSLNLKDAEVLSGFKNLASSIKRSFTRQSARLDKYYAEQTEALATQEAHIVSLYGLVGTKY
jgi:hypothetical protein